MIEADVLQEINRKLDAMQPRLDGIPLLAQAIEVLQRDVRGLRDDLRVTSAMVMRLDGTMGNLLPELTAIHRWMISMNDRVRKLENAGSE